MDHQQEEDDKTVAGLASVLESRVFCVRNNDPNMNHLFIGSGLDPRAWKQLGRWLHKSEHVKYACFTSCHLKGKSMEDLCAGMQHNRSIQEFEIGDNVLKTAEIQSLCPFIKDNPVLHTLNIEGCLDASSVELLSSALMGRDNSIENVSLDGNCLGGAEKRGSFDTFIKALSQNSKLRRLSLMGNQIGKEACQTLSTLLSNPGSTIKSLVLRHNYIDNECSAILAESLVHNTSLNNIDLDRNEIGPKGLMHFLHLVNKTPRATIKITLRWRRPGTSDEMRVGVKAQLDEPLEMVLSQTPVRQRFSWISGDFSNVRVLLGGVPLELSESIFFHGIKGGTVVDITECERFGPRPNPNLFSAPMLVDDDGGDRANGIRDTVASNHTITSIGYETALRRGFAHGELLREFLEANKRDERSAARVKIFRYHIQHYLSVEDFYEMETVMSLVLAWIGVALSEADGDRNYLSSQPPDIVRLDAMYQIFRAMPMLCGR